MASDWTTPPVVPTVNASKNMGDTERNPSINTEPLPFLPPMLISQERKDTTHLAAVLDRRDLTGFLVLAVLFVPTITSVQSAGPAAFFYFLLALFTFLLPGAFVIRWLVRRFPGQGAPYFRVIHILGAKWSFLAAFCAWWPGSIAIIIAIGIGIMSVQYLAPAWFTSPTEHFLLIMAVLLVATPMACLPLSWLKRILLVLAAPYYSFYMTLGAAGGWWLWSGHPAAVSLRSLHDLKPTGNNLVVYGLVLLGCLGIFMPLFMGGKIGGTQNARHYVWWSVALVFFAYLAGTFGVMIIVPPAQSGAFSASLQAISMVFGPLAGTGAAIVLACSQIAISVAFLLLFSRLLVLFSRDYQLATPLTRLNRHGVPILSTITQAIIVAGIAMLTFVAIPELFEKFVHTADLLLEICFVLSAGTAALWELSAALLFFCTLGLYFRYKRTAQTIPASQIRTYSHNDDLATAHENLLSPEVNQRPDGQRNNYQGLLLIGLAITGAGASLTGMWEIVSHSWNPKLIPTDQWIVLVGGVILFSLAIGWVVSEVARVNTLLEEQRHANFREVTLREQLQEAYDQQQVLLAEVDWLYREQARAAVTDTITGLPNHRAVMNRLDEEIARCQQEHASCAVLFVDLDYFKQINDTWGHRAGDVILRAAGSRLCSTLHPHDFAGRYGGEEFAIVLTDADVSEASQTAERLRMAVAAQPFYWENEETYTVVPIEVTASIGVAVYQLHGVSREALLEHADSAMYQAKDTGRNRVCIANLELTSCEKMPFAHEVNRATECAIMRALIAAASAHDNGTNAHAQRMVQLAESTARMLNRPEEEIRLITLAALLHDIGKIGIPDTILHKQGPLTYDEWAIMRRHPEIGQQILAQAGGIFEQVAHIVATHHEHWDGHGYPAGLAYDAIPMSARILSVADAYDAMISRRSYRDPLPAANARAELERCAGSQFDPLVVKTFFTVLDAQEHSETEIKIPKNSQTMLALPASISIRNGTTNEFHS
jgi:diguanylate cyclase (GGDEF)-like protein